MISNSTGGGKTAVTAENAPYLTCLCLQDVVDEYDEYDPNIDLDTNYELGTSR